MRMTVLISLFAMCVACPALAASQTETIIFIRHGEKPENGFGQLSCKGLNRALKLPAVIAREFGKPDAIFAPNPARLKNDEGKDYAYVRPLATIEPTAISFSMPVDTRFGFDEIDELQAALLKPKYRDKTVLVAWEHKQIVKLVKQLLKSNNGSKNAAMKWQGDDFDGIYVVKITRDGDHTKAAFERRSQNLNNQSVSCPQ